jgi:predicted RNase H-like HicB family nuclease
MKELYIYPAVFSFEEENIKIQFPDLKIEAKEGRDMEEALKVAKKTLEEYLYDLDAQGKNFPKATSLKEMRLEENEQFIMVPASILAGKKLDNRAIKKTLTIPKWLNDEALKNDLNFSSILRKALMRELGF